MTLELGFDQCGVHLVIYVLVPLTGKPRITSLKVITLQWVQPPLFDRT